ncbi:probable ubiquitin carboxyl-terminal hydrolase MINDY-4 isoform X2 [Neocloeon triangulifer]|uniref:probable ubiquitin carboxyl-terminal hydrolase MINDY-4 isoform X2 n=1 Tax=Neocloeon triangulifer TaxID=2078957 RepID=UPI00286F06DD|nr:probable ubiquitin carboxyl-terminal hydrolase MINDY-4 isoform X2 [Neocloeon triangulifer]
MGDLLQSTVENVALSLIREFLSTKGFHSVLLNMDVEIPRGPNSISSRHLLSSLLGLQRPAKGEGSILETLVTKTLGKKASTLFANKINASNTYREEKEILELTDVNEKISLSASSLLVLNEIEEVDDDTESMPISEPSSRSEKLGASSCESASGNQVDKIEVKQSNIDDSSLSLTDDNLKEIETDLVVTNLADNFDIETPETEGINETVDSLEESCDKMNCEMESTTVEKTKVSNAPLPKEEKIIFSQKRLLKVTTLPEPKLKNESVNTPSDTMETTVEKEMPELEKETDTAPPPEETCSRPLTLPSAMELKSVLLGTPEGQFFKEWKERQLFIPGADGLQNFENGINGILAVVQGFISKEVTFCRVDKKEEAFIRAVSEILWQCGQKSRACLAICGEEERLVGCGRYRRDGITEAMILLHFNSMEDTAAGVERHVGQLKAPGGLLLLVASLVLSKGLDEFRGRPPLLSRANVSLVNLALTGRLDMREAKQRAEIGLLSLAEHYGHIRVPSCLKTPRWPIWVVELGPDKYSVILSVNPKLVADWRAELAFRLQILDGDGIKNAAITTGGELHEEEEKTASYLEMTIRTKWSGAQIQWIPK